MPKAGILALYGQCSKCADLQQGFKKLTLNEHQFSVTRLATTGGFLKKGNVTLMIGTEAEKVDDAIHLIKDTCGKRQKITCSVPAPNIPPFQRGI